MCARVATSSHSIASGVRKAEAPPPAPAATEQPTSRQFQGKVAYMMSRFPKITETFILYEMLAMEKLGVTVEVYPLRRERTKVVHPEAVDYVKRAHFEPLVSWPLLKAHLRYLRTQPTVYLHTLWTLLRANWGSMRYFFGALDLFPKAVYFAELMEAEGIEHIHAHFASHPAAAAFVIHRLTGIPYSFTGHGSDIHRDRHMMREKVEEAAFAVTISNYNRDIIVNECNGQMHDKVLVIHCGVDTQLFQPRTAPTPYEQGAGPFAILCIGTLHEVKGQTYLIDACRQLKAQGIDFVCHFAGDGPDLDKLQKQAAQAGLTEAMRFHGRLKREEIVNLLHKADVVVAPSVPTRDGRREGIPVVLMEAMGSTVPVISTRLSGIPELVEHGKSGLLTEPGDVDALAAALVQLYQDPALRQRFGQVGRAKVTGEFDLTINAAQLAHYFGMER